MPNNKLDSDADSLNMENAVCFFFKNMDDSGISRKKNKKKEKKLDRVKNYIDHLLLRLFTDQENYTLNLLSLKLAF